MLKYALQPAFDFARQIIEFETGRRITEYTNYKLDCRLRYMHTDILWFFTVAKIDLMRNHLGSVFKNSTDQIFSIRDPWPFVTYSLQAMKKLSPENEEKKEIIDEGSTNQLFF